MIYAPNQKNYLITDSNDPATYNSLIQKILEEVSKGSFPSDHLKQGYKEEQFLEMVLNNYFELAFDLKYEGDLYNNMSEGKKAFVHLKLILEFSDNKYPLLIDQPEDDLDNRSIYHNLVSYIKKKKHTRQIILVTHNPNLVVGADAEEIIVANQHGKTTPNNDEQKFQYISGSLENSSPKNNRISATLESQGIREHVCDILEGGRDAFKKREDKYGFSKN